MPENKLIVEILQQINFAVGRVILSPMLGKAYEKIAVLLGEASFASSC